MLGFHNDLHSKILSGLANVIADPRSKATSDEIEQLFKRCPSVPIDKSSKDILSKHDAPGLGTMNRTSEKTITALVQYTIKVDEEQQLKLLPRLLAYVRHLPAFNWEAANIENAPPPADAITYVLVSGLLFISYHQSQSVYEEIIQTLWQYAEFIIKLMSENVEDTVTFILPSLAGLSRALQLSPFLYRPNQLSILCQNTQSLIRNDTLDLIRISIQSCLRDAEGAAYSRRVIAYYLRQENPLGSNRIILDLLIIFRNTLGRILADNKPSLGDDYKIPSLSTLNLAKSHETTDGINAAWQTLLHEKMARNILEDSIADVEKKRGFKETLVYIRDLSLEYFDNIRSSIDETGQSQEALDTYIEEIIGTSMHVATAASIALQEVHHSLVDHLVESLIGVQHVTGPWVYVASLDSAVLLALNFPHLNHTMTRAICHFLAHLSERLVTARNAEQAVTNLRQQAITALACIVKVTGQDQMAQAALSVIHTLMNQITHHHTNGKVGENLKDIANGAHTSPAMHSDAITRNVYSAILGLAASLKNEHVISQTFSMFAVRRKTLSPTVLAQLLQSLVNLALVSQTDTFQDIINLLSTISKEILLKENNTLSNAVLTAQLDLAKRLEERSEYFSLYLQNLLTLFTDNAATIQRTTIENRKENDYALARKLGQLLPILDALLSHEKLNPHFEQSVEETVSLFRNMWFYSVLFGFVTEPIWIREWHKNLLNIAGKTPALILVSTSHYLETELEHNAAIRGVSAITEQKAYPLRQKLEHALPSLQISTRNFSFPQLLFCTSVYHVEMLRSRSGNCSFILRYFMVENGLNTSNSNSRSERNGNASISSTSSTTATKSSSNNNVITHCLEMIADQVAHNFLKDISLKAMNSIVKQTALQRQVADLLQLCCHKRKKVHQLAIKTMDRFISSCPQLFTDGHLVTLLLELVQLTWLACEGEYRDEYSPVYQFTSARASVTIELGDSYAYRREICTKLFEKARHWLQTSLSRASLEVTGLLQDYLAESNCYEGLSLNDSVHMGRNLAIELTKGTIKNELSIDFAPKFPPVVPNQSSSFFESFRNRQFYSGEISGMEYLLKLRDNGQGESSSTLSDQAAFIIDALTTLKSEIEASKTVATEQLYRVLYRSAAFVIASPTLNTDIIRHLVHLPVLLFSLDSMKVGINVWNWLLVQRPELEDQLMAEIVNEWSWAQQYGKGLFSPILNFEDPFTQRMTYGPSHKAIRDANHKLATQLFTPHSQWIKFLSSRFYAIRHKSKQLVHMLVHLLYETFQNVECMSTHALARSVRFSLLQLGLKVLQSTRLEAVTEYNLRVSLYNAAFDWFAQTPQWHYGGHRSLALLEIRLLTDVYYALLNDTPDMTYIVTCTSIQGPNSKITAGHYMFVKDKTKEDALKQHKQAQKLLLLLVENEISKLSVWNNPLRANDYDVPSTFTTSTEKSMTTDESWKEMIRFAWSINPKLAVYMDGRFAALRPIVRKELIRHIINSPMDVIDVPEALMIILGDGSDAAHNLKHFDMKYLQYWAPVPPITASNYLSSIYGKHPLLLQYCMRSLNSYPVETVFFYIPQIVQALRFDDPKLKYVENYILETANSSQLFAHQIIWNMKANFFVDADKECEQPDALKPTLERIIQTMVSRFTGDDREFYEREFKFFGEVTAISGYLKEYIKHGQTEKKPLQKKRLDEELQKIKVDVGVYLPSNPDGHVVDIDRQSGRPLQSHAKAPFMATFLIEKDVPVSTNADASSDETNPTLQQQFKLYKKAQIWQGAIFKVGDDCRQDVLALQLIAVFKNIFTSVGLDLYVYPYRVVATAPGRGVIDVIPNSISRDQMGREKVNSLYDYFIAKYGGSESSIAFQRARTNFVTSVAAYSIISYLLQIKDRHNGNIMVDDEGHMIHIDFGFIFDIAPGGITFENSPFKLTNEMIQVMGGGSQEQAFRQFSELVIKAYLATRPYAEQIMQLVTLMLQSGLPCFKGETIKRMRYRFQLDKSDRAAADFMMMRIKDSFANQRTVLYDYFQKLTNGIPY